MKKNNSGVLLLVFLVFFISNSALAVMIIDTTTNWPGTSMGTFGPDSMIGQTFAVDPVDNRLDYFALYVADNLNPDFMTFNFHVIEWSIPQLKAVGPVLYSSESILSTNNQGFDGWERIVFETNGLELNSSKAYIAIVSTPSNFNGTCWLGYAGDVYSGEFAYSSGSIEIVNNINWTTDYPGHNGDLVCELGFNVPEPSTILLLSLGTLILRRRKK